MGLLIPEPCDEFTVDGVDQVARRYAMEICQGDAGGWMVRLVA